MFFHLTDLAAHHALQYELDAKEVDLKRFYNTFDHCIRIALNVFKPSHN